ncbi:MAG: hypothetical protein H6925_05315 [Holosporaceae bacterium]|nr:MAG: hypothetical protein H6925_05315 [Holosporaceae bacterium]
MHWPRQKKKKAEAVAKHAELTADHETATADLAKVRAEKNPIDSSLRRKKKRPISQKLLKKPDYASK